MIVKEIVQFTVTDLRSEAYYSLAFEHQTYKEKNGNSANYSFNKLFY